MKRKKSYLVVMGIPSLFLIFSVLCFIILALLSYGTSRSDYKMSEQALLGTAAYYNTCNQATDIFSSFVSDYQKLSKECKSKKEYEKAFVKAIDDIQGADVYYDNETGYGEFCLAISDTQELYIRFSLNQKDHMPHIDSWKNQVSGDWSPDLKQNVYQK